MAKNYKNNKWDKKKQGNGNNKKKALKAAKRNKFVDDVVAESFSSLPTILSVLDNANTPYHVSTGSLDPSNLESVDHKKHGALYIDLLKMPDEFLKKKFGDNHGKTSHFKKAVKTLEFIQKILAPHMELIEEGQVLSCEQMLQQNHAYNKIKRGLDFSQGCAIIHGSTVLKFDDNFKQFLKNSDIRGHALDKIMEHFKCEGFVIVTPDGKRFKLKREYFVHFDEKKQRGVHKIGPCVAQLKNDLSKEICGNEEENPGYVNVPLFMHSEGIDHHETISELEVTFGETVGKVSLVALPIREVIQQVGFKNYFTGQKMMSLFKTIGSREKYRYSEYFETQEENLFELDLMFQQKYDGETILVKKVNGLICILVKFQVDVYKIKSKNCDVENIKFEFGFF